MLWASVACLILGKDGELPPVPTLFALPLPPTKLRSTPRLPVQKKKVQNPPAFMLYIRNGIS